jgi:glycosyltransferase involved in cell wall biosynthesis
LVVWVHGAVSGRHWLERLARRATPDAVFSNSHFTADHAHRLFPRVTPVVIYPPVEHLDGGTDRSSTIRQDLGITADQTMIVQVGRIEPGKGLDLHIRALAKLRDDPRWTLCLVGTAATRHDRRYLHRVRLDAQHHGIDRRVRFLGARRDVSAILATADIYCQPNVAPEGFGITFVEAMQARLPVITTRMGAAPEIVDGACGVLVEPDADALAGHLAELIGNPDRRRAIGARGPEHARCLCDPSEQVAKLDAALAHVIA